MFGVKPVFKGGAPLVVELAALVSVCQKGSRRKSLKLGYADESMPCWMPAVLLDPLGGDAMPERSNMPCGMFMALDDASPILFWISVNDDAKELGSKVVLLLSPKML